MSSRQGALATVERQPRACYRTRDGYRGAVASTPSVNTRRAYRADWADFVAWCASQRRRALPATPATVAAYVAWSGERHRPSTVHRRLAAISFEHAAVGAPSPCRHDGVRAADALVAWHGRDLRSPAAPATVDHVLSIVRCFDESAAGRRDHALVLVMFGAGLRRAQVAALDLADVRVGRRSLRIAVPARPEILVPAGSRPELCAVTAWRAWLRLRSVPTPVRDPGPVPAFCPVDRFDRIQPGRLSDRGVSRVVARAAVAAGIDPHQITTGSLRAGLVRVAKARGVADDTIMRQTGHRQARRVRELSRSR